MSTHPHEHYEYEITLDGPFGGIAYTDSREAAMLAARTLRQDWIDAGGSNPPPAIVKRNGIVLYTHGDVPAAAF